MGIAEGTPAHDLRDTLGKWDTGSEAQGRRRQQAARLGLTKIRNQKRKAADQGPADEPRTADAELRGEGRELAELRHECPAANYVGVLVEVATGCPVQLSAIRQDATERKTRPAWSSFRPGTANVISGLDDPARQPGQTAPRLDPRGMVPRATTGA